jgi:hypothetical protein
MSMLNDADQVVFHFEFWGDTRPVPHNLLTQLPDEPRRRAEERLQGAVEFTAQGEKMLQTKEGTSLAELLADLAIAGYVLCAGTWQRRPNLRGPSDATYIAVRFVFVKNSGSEPNQNALAALKTMIADTVCASPSTATRCTATASW